MKPNEYTHLHLHTDASFLDGYGTVERTVTHAKSLGFEGLGITEHGNLTNTLLFNETCKDMGIKPIIGLEGYVSQDGSRFHITLLADGNVGFKNLVKLNNIGYENFNSRPTFDIADLVRHNEGVIVLSGCPESPLQKPEFEDAKQTFSYLKRAFGDRLFVEMMLVNYGKPYERAMLLAEHFGTDIILTNDVHFAKKTDAENHRRLLKMKTGGFDYDSKHLYLATPDELIDRLENELNRKDLTNDVIQAMHNANTLAKKLGTVEFNNNPKLPHIPNAAKTLWALIEKGYQSKCASGEIQASSVYEDRFKYEYKVIIDSEYSSYFLILHDIINYAHKQNIWVGKGRGSGAGSLILFLIGITGIDPIKYNLLFERFLNPKRADMPDVDTDFESEKRDLVLEYASKKWKSTNVATYSTYQHKSTVKDLAKVFDVPKNLAREAGDYGVESAQFKQICDSNKDFLSMYEGINNQYRHVGKHAGGIVINEDGFPLPLIRTTNGQLVSSWTEGGYRELSKVGLVKFDILGLSAGSVIRRLKQKLNVEVPEPVDNHEVFTLFQTGNTNGIFQFGGSDGIIQFCKNVQPVSINDLIAINALFRPGPLDSGAAFEYPELKRQGKQRSLHKDIDHFLTDTYGVLCVAENSLIKMGDGANKKIQDMSVGDYVVTLNEGTYKLENKKILAINRNGIKKTITVKTIQGREISCTPDHKVFTMRGWIEAQDLLSSDLIAVPKFSTKFDAEFDINKLKVLAYLIGDGYIGGSHNISFINKDYDLIEDFNNCALSFSDNKITEIVQVRNVGRSSVVRKSGNKGHNLLYWLRELGIHGKTSSNKFVPKFIFGLSNKLKEQFLATLWDTDGHISNQSISYKTISKQLAQDVSQLMFDCGIYNSISSFKNTEYMVRVYGDYDVFVNNIQTKMLSKDKKYVVVSMKKSPLKVSKIVFQKEVIENGFTQRDLEKEFGVNRSNVFRKNKNIQYIGSSGLKNLLEILPETSKYLNVYWDEVKSITVGTDCEVYDLTVEDNHNFFANNLLVHNCYQEQVMQVFAFVIDGDFADADLARKVISKANPNNPSWVKKYNELEKQFFDGAKNHNWTHQETKKVWDEIKTHSGYSFNKSHSTAYALLAWELAWFKFYYPTDFYCELLNVEKEDSEKVESYMFEFVLKGGAILNPDINKSTNEYICDSNTNSIYLPLVAVKYMSEKTYQKLIPKRPFTSIEDFMLRVSKSDVKSQGREGLLALGAFSNIESSDEPYKILQVEDTSGLTKPQVQLKYLGFMLPTPKFLQQKERAEKEGYIVGVVHDIDKRNKGYGDYFVVKMKPEGSFWYVKKGFMGVNEGDLIAVQKKDNGQAIDIVGLSM